jgi:hypothetical protein
MVYDALARGIEGGVRRPHPEPPNPHQPVPARHAGAPPRRLGLEPHLRALRSGQGRASGLHGRGLVPWWVPLAQYQRPQRRLRATGPRVSPGAKHHESGRAAGSPQPDENAWLAATERYKTATGPCAATCSDRWLARADAGPVTKPGGLARASRTRIRGSEMALRALPAGRRHQFAACSRGFPEQAASRTDSPGQDRTRPAASL